MGFSKISFSLLAAAASTVVAVDPCISTTSWNDSRLDLFPLASDGSIAHKFWTWLDWEPVDKFEPFPSQARSCPSVSTWGEGRLDVVYINSSRVNSSGGNVLHKYFSGGSWGPSWENAEDLGGNVDYLSSASWGANRLDIVAKAKNGSYVHKAWTGDGWFPGKAEWEHLGCGFFSSPAIVSWGIGRLDIVGLDSGNASLQHKYYQDGCYDGWSGWEDLGGGPFIGNPVATSWGEGRLDFWAINSAGELNHIYWDGHKYSEWENLGGEFTDTPKVVHWKPSRIDIVGKGLDDDQYYGKSYDGSEWHPSGNEWHKLAGPFNSEPALVAKHDTTNSTTDFLYVFGVDEDDAVQMKIWSGSYWQPESEKTWLMGHLSSAHQANLFQDDEGQSVLEMSGL
ncbi:Uu.00g029060.m01.CDS01 [Anthostomella pinea]|uniref:Uu.00g029060.m01.CDS01 n=1 Tax=Anthostomella pinea TaxID=933095 RepID=A0AAI8V831_9PEZI|nr:Uu.00g029060.m01.CDS01 [Anthostomella pinea]